MRLRIFGLVLAGGLLWAGSVAAACRTVSVWDSRTGQAHYEQICDNTVIAPRNSFLDVLDGINRSQRPPPPPPRCETISVWDADEGDYHYEQRCTDDAVDPVVSPPSVWQPECQMAEVWDSETGQYHYEQRCR